LSRQRTFPDSGFQQAVKDCNQKITYCAVGTYHQNGIVEQRIKEFTLISQMLLLHAKHLWPDYVTTIMWPFALKEAAYQLIDSHYNQTVAVVRQFSLMSIKISLIP
jgi:hypothetical protein